MNDDLKCFERAVAWVGGLVLFGLVIVALTSCNVTRTVTTTAQTIQRGDTTTVIMTKTIESYDGKVDASRLAPFVQ